MKLFRTAVAAFIAALALQQVAAADRNDYPARPVTLVTPFAPGNAPDVLVRAMAQIMARETGQSFVVESKAGAGTLLAAQAVAKAAPDGHTVLITGSTTFAANRHLFRKLPYDPVKDFQMVTALAKGPSMLYANPNLPAKTVPELVALAKRKPGSLSFADATAPTRVLGALLQQRTGASFTRVPYKNLQQALPDLMGGQIDLLFTDLTWVNHVKQGKLRALAIADTKRSELAPDVPTLEELGIKDVNIGFMLEIAVPAGTPMPVVERLRALVSKAAGSAEVKPAYATGGMYPYLTTPRELSALNEAEAVRWGELVRSVGMEPQ